MPLPNPGLDAVPFTPLTAQFLDDMIENIESLAAGSGFDQDAIDTPSLAPGSVTGPKIDVPSVLALAYPIGSIYINAGSGTNPATLLGFGTWVSFGQGRVLTGVNPSDSDFNTPAKTSGQKSYTLSNSNIPRYDSTVTFHGAGTATVLAQATGNAITNGTQRNRYRDGTNTTGASSRDSFRLQIGATNNTPVPLLQPYITAYMWRRTA